MSLVFQNLDPPPPPNKGGGTHSPGGEGGGGGSIFWKTRDIVLPSYSNNLSTGHTIKANMSEHEKTINSGPLGRG
jgi:hypothetical protein